MTQDSEDRLKEILGKLYRSPRPTLPALSRPGGGDVTASKGMTGRVLASRAHVGKALPCRPWDRDDLIRRLVTFKAMTWFGKPKDISPVNCARRGWINVEMDVIVCEACGARLLFSTSPSWPLQQVEKAAAVFSLKLDTGHKLLCPWINNACDESLASFPPSAPQSLVRGFKERSHILLRLTALPVISSLAIDYMKSPQLDRVLSAPVHPSITLNDGVRLIDDCRSNHLDGAAEDDTSHDYYQAQNIISLCGWEPRLLPYTIYFEEQLDSSAKTSNLLQFSEEIPREEHNISSCSSRGHNDVKGRKDIYLAEPELPYDQSSTVLDCRFCGACVGLWFFKMIPRPLESFKVIIDSGCQNELATGTADLTQRVKVPIVNFGRGDHTSNIDKPLGLHLSIAGGPSPNKQHFRPKVTIPVVSRHLRAELLFNSCLRYQQDTSGKEDHACNQEFSSSHHDDGSQAVRSLKRKQNEVEVSNHQLHVGGNHGDVNNGLAGEGISEHTTEEILTPCTDIILRNVVPCQNGSPSTDSREANNSVSRLPDESNFGHLPENDKIERSLTVSDESNCSHIPFDPSFSASSSVINVNSTSYSKSGEMGPCFPTTEQASVGKQVSIGFAKEISVSITPEENVNHLPDDNLRPSPVIGFDPIKQHRPFCPWIFEEGKNLPGWKLTVSALDTLDITSQQPEQIAAASYFLDMTDDPIVSVRKLFTSPQSKKFKGIQ